MIVAQVKINQTLLFQCSFFLLDLQLLPFLLRPYFLMQCHHCINTFWIRFSLSYLSSIKRTNINLKHRQEGYYMKAIIPSASNEQYSAAT